MSESNENTVEHPEETTQESAEAAEVDTTEEELSGDVENQEDGVEGAEAAGEDEEEEDTRPRRPVVNVASELLRLSELATRYPEIGPIVAQLAMKTGFRDIGERLMRAGFDAEERGIEYFSLAADLARKEKRPTDAVRYAIKAVKEAVSSEELGQEEANRLPHVLRIAFSALMFDLEDLNAIPEFAEVLNEDLPKLAPKFADDAFFHTIWAQAAWFQDKARSEEIWEKATELNDPESTWNARGTWYKEAEKNIQMAKDAYRRGLKRTGASALLAHNLAQIFMDEAAGEGIEPQKAHELLEEADRQMRRGLRLNMRRGLRRHMQATMDRLVQQRRALPKVEAEPPKEGETVKGRVRSITHFGAFLSLPGGLQGLLHNSEIAHEHVKHAGDFMKVGDDVEVKVIEVATHQDGKPKIGFSRKALLAAPERKEDSGERAPRKPRPNNNRRDSGSDNRNNGGRNNQNNSSKGGGRNQKSSNRGPGPKRSHTEEPNADTNLGSLGELLLHKLEEAKKDK